MKLKIINFSTLIILVSSLTVTTNNTAEKEKDNGSPHIPAARWPILL
jgi:hypothetical protein